MKFVREQTLTIGAVAKRVGCAVSAIRFYSDKGLIQPIRTQSGHRVFPRSIIRRVSFILISQRLGFTLAEIEQALLALPQGRTPTKDDWAKLAEEFEQELDNRIREMRQMKERLTGCIGCGCLSLEKCHLYNPNDKVGELRSGSDLFFNGIDVD